MKEQLNRIAISTSNYHHMSQSYFHPGWYMLTSILNRCRKITKTVSESEYTVAAINTSVKICFAYLKLFVICNEIINK